jgi:chromatin remodeling complex protein RSC6
MPPTKRSSVSSLIDSITTMQSMIESSDEISLKAKTKLLKQLQSISKHTKQYKPKEPKEPKEKGTSQFEKKMNGSADMAAFAGWEMDSLHSRVDVTKAVWDYVKEHKLQDETDKRKCKLDTTLKSILGVGDEVDVVSYPIIQKHIGRHLIKVE